MKGSGVAVDTDNNVYFCSSSSPGNPGYWEVSKYNSSGALQWQKELASGGPTYGIALDSSANVYVCGRGDTYSAIWQVVKYDTSGALQWQKSISPSYGGTVNSVTVDSSGNVYTCGYTATSAGELNYDRLQIIKYNTSGTVQWQISGVPPESQSLTQGASIAIDSSGNVYICANYIQYGGDPSSFTVVYYGQISKYNSSGTLQWQRKVGTSLTFVLFYGICVDSSANVYVCGYANTLMKYDTSGTLQWQRTLSVSYSWTSVAVDSSDNVYASGSYSSSAQIAKYNSSGSIQWQRQISIASNANYAASIAVRGNNLYITGNSFISGGNQGNMLFAKLPTSGALTGTYSVGGNSVVYSASSLTDSAQTYASASGTLSASATSYTSSTSSLTNQATSFTSSVTTL
jgi:hypothetical protein